jgi:2-desacetyl-2-hydroxyethyl bacteriochlorophyllide A dehydrogenase
MKQVVLSSPGSFAERESPPPVQAAGEALVRVRKVGVCGSDFHAFAGRHPSYTYPRVLGHELSGTVVEVAANGKGIREGDNCAIEPYVSCGNCRACLGGRNNCCERLQILGVNVDGGMQEYLPVPVALLHTSDILSLEQLALVETLGIGAHAVMRSGLAPGGEAMVIGCGPIGISVLQFASALGASVHMVEKNEWRRRFVEGMGFSTSESPEGRVADVVFDATGNAAAMGSSLNHVATGGKLVYVGLTKDPVCLDDALFHRRELSILASRNSVGLFPRIIQLIESGKIDTSPWVTHRMAMSQVPSDFEGLLKMPGLIKAIVDIADLPVQ